jgi:alkylation response protein AidB-like acyl-CoA dehydrogenase
LVAHEFGCHAAPGPLVDTNVVAAALNQTGGDRHDEALAKLMSGAATASWCLGEPARHDLPGTVTMEIGVVGDEVVLNGVKRPVESAAQASHFLVTGRTGAGMTQVLVPSHATGVWLKPLRTVDLSRRFWEVSFRDVRVPVTAAVGAIGEADDQVERQLQIAIVILAAEAVGAMQAAFDLTVEWAFDRYSFGRPLASYQALKHRFAFMKAWLEAGHALADAAALAVQEESPDAAELVSVTKAFVGDYGTELVQDCVQMHGGIGLTYDHDLHLFARRVTLNRTLFGSPADHRQRLADLVDGRTGRV